MTNEAKHTPEPWFADSEGKIWRRHPSELYQNGGGVAGDKPLAQCDKQWYGEGSLGYPNVNNAKRIVACVNACEGLDTKSLESGKAVFMADFTKLHYELHTAKKQKEEFLSILKSVISMWDDIYPDMESGKYPQERLEHAEFTEMAAARAAIEKIESRS